MAAGGWAWAGRTGNSAVAERMDLCTPCLGGSAPEEGQSPGHHRSWIRAKRPFQGPALSGKIWAMSAVAGFG